MGYDQIYNVIEQTFFNVLGMHNPKIVFIGYRQTGKSTLLNAAAGAIIFQSGPSSTVLTEQVEQKTIKNTTYCDTPGFDYWNPEKAGDAISKLLKEGGSCKILFVVNVDITSCGGWITSTDSPIMRLILEAAPEIGNRYGIIVNNLSEEKIEALSNLERFAKNIFSNIKPEQHSGSIHFIKNDPDLKDKRNQLIKASERQDLNKFIDNEVPTIELTRNSSEDVKVDKFNGNM